VSKNGVNPAERPYARARAIHSPLIQPGPKKGKASYGPYIHPLESTYISGATYYGVCVPPMVEYLLWMRDIVGDVSSRRGLRMGLKRGLRGLGVLDLRGLRGLRVLECPLLIPFLSTNY